MTKKMKLLPTPRVSKRKKVQREFFSTAMMTPPPPKVGIMEGRNKKSVTPTKLAFNVGHAKTILEKGNTSATKSHPMKMIVANENVLTAKSCMVKEVKTKKAQLVKAKAVKTKKKMTKKVEATKKAPPVAKKTPPVAKKTMKKAQVCGKLSRDDTDDDDDDKDPKAVVV
jgi:hypothetical protein